MGAGVGGTVGAGVGGTVGAGVGCNVGGAVTVTLAVFWLQTHCFYILVKVKQQL